MTRKRGPRKKSARAASVAARAEDPVPAASEPTSTNESTTLTQGDAHKNIFTFSIGTVPNASESTSADTFATPTQENILVEVSKGSAAANRGSSDDMSTNEAVARKHRLKGVLKSPMGAAGDMVPGKPIAADVFATSAQRMIEFFRNHEAAAASSAASSPTFANDSAASTGEASLVNVPGRASSVRAGVVPLFSSSSGTISKPSPGETLMQLMAEAANAPPDMAPPMSSGDSNEFTPEEMRFRGLEAMLRNLNTIEKSRVVLESPRVVSYREFEDGMPCFLYLSPVERGDHASTVLVDVQENILPLALKLPAVVAKPPPGSFREPCYRIDQTPDRGLGMFAKRRIKAGELVIAERPVYVSNGHLFSKRPENRYADEEFYNSALSGLSPAYREAVQGLHNAYPPGTDIDRVSATILTNCFEARIYDRSACAALFPTLSRVNHACSPNVNYHWSCPNFCGQCFATRDIAENEEITVLYINELASQADRQKALAQRYSFTCKCKTCSLSPSLQKENDARRKTIGIILTSLRDSKAGELPRYSLEGLQQVLQWAEEDGLTTRYAQLLYHGSKCVTAHIDPEIGLQWLKDARKAYTTVLGEDSLVIRDVDSAGIMLAKKLQSVGLSGDWPTTSI